MNAAKGIALARNLPLVGVHHIEGHIAANWLIDELQDYGEIAMPATCLIVSGGHTDLIRMSAPGEYGCSARPSTMPRVRHSIRVRACLASGIPADPPSSTLPRPANPTAIPFPRAWLNDSFDFSFSGLKTALLRLVEPYRVEPVDTPEPIREPFATHVPPTFRADMPVADLAAGFQEAIVDVLVGKTLAAARGCNARTVILAGGVAGKCQIARSRWKPPWRSTITLRA